MTLGRQWKHGLRSRDIFQSDLVVKQMVVVFLVLAFWSQSLSFITIVFKCAYFVCCEDSQIHSVEGNLCWMMLTSFILLMSLHMNRMLTEALCYHLTCCRSIKRLTICNPSSVLVFVIISYAWWTWSFSSVCWVIKRYAVFHHTSDCAS